jgi:hypothetical protein
MKLKTLFICLFACAMGNSIPLFSDGMIDLAGEQLGEYIGQRILEESEQEANETDEEEDQNDD